MLIQAVGTWLSHRIIGLDRDGYGTLLGEAIFTCARVGLWRTPESHAYKS